MLGGLHGIVALSPDPSSTSRSGTGRRVLIVDDDPDFRVLVRMHLEARGYQVVGEAGNGAAAISDAFRLDPDVITLDSRMPYLSGESALEHINAIRPKSKVVVLSGTLADAPPWADVFLSKDRVSELPAIIDELFD